MKNVVSVSGERVVMHYRKSYASVLSVRANSGWTQEKEQ